MVNVRSPGGGWLSTLITLGAMLLLVGAAFTVGAATANAGGHSSTRTEFTDKAGRHCTQVGTSALDCDYPPAENRLGDALNGLVNP